MPTKYGFPTHWERYLDLEPTPEDLIRRVVDPYLMLTIGPVQRIVEDYIQYSLNLGADISWIEEAWEYPLDPDSHGRYVLSWPETAVLSMRVTYKEGELHGVLLVYIDLQEDDEYLMAKAITDVTPLEKDDFELVPLSVWFG